MSEQKHTPEPWIGRHYGGSMYRIETENGSVADVQWWSWGETNQTTSEANAARIVQCVNALAGVADPAAELARLRGIEKVYPAAVKECKQWRFEFGYQDGAEWRGRKPYEPDPMMVEAIKHDLDRAEAGMEAL